MSLPNRRRVAVERRVWCGEPRCRFSSPFPQPFLTAVSKGFCLSVRHIDLLLILYNLVLWECINI